MFINILRRSWPLFLGIAFIMIGNGLQVTLTSWRAAFEGFDADITGWVMTSYYIGFLAGSTLTSKFLNHVGHVRVFAALASLASSVVLFQSFLVVPSFWMITRLITGFCYAGIYVIVESWLNEQSSNKTRGSTMSMYMLITYGSMSLGQWFMNIQSPTGTHLFITSSILLSIALIPLLLTRVETPEIKENERTQIRELAKISPSGTVSVFVSAIAHGSLFGMGAVFALNIGMNVSEIALFMSLVILSGAITTWPLGWLTDSFDRRYFIFALAMTAILASVLMYVTTPGGILFFVAVCVLGGSSLPLYSISVAQINDRLEPKKMVSASGAIVLVVGFGAILGPLATGYVMNFLGDVGFLIILVSTHIVIVITVAITMFWREAVSEEDQISYQPIALDPTVVAMDVLASETVEIIRQEQAEQEN